MPFLATASSVGRLLFFGGQSMTRGIHARLDGFENVAAGEVDRGGPFEIEVDDLRFAGGDHRANDERHVAAGQVVGFEAFGGEAFAFVDAGLHGHDLAAGDDGGIHLAEGHAEQVEDADAGAGGDRLNPEAEVAGEDREERERDDQRAEQQHEPQRVVTEQPTALPGLAPRTASSQVDTKRFRPR